MSIKNIFIYISLFIFQLASGQNPTQTVRNGNKLYTQKNYSEAEKNYRKALEKKPDYHKAAYNLGGALYKQKRYKEATAIYDTLSKNSSISKDLQAKINHNLGNALLMYASKTDTLKPEQKQELLKRSIEAYKKSLRLNPKDEESRYNLSYAKQLLQKQIQQQKQQQQQNNKKDQQNKDQQNKQQQPQNQDQKKDQNDKKPNPQTQKKQMSKEEAERILNAIKNNEKKTIDKVNEQQLRKDNQRLEKDW